MIQPVLLTYNQTREYKLTSVIGRSHRGPWGRDSSGSSGAWCGRQPQHHTLGGFHHSSNFLFKAVLIALLMELVIAITEKAALGGFHNSTDL